MKKAAGLLAPLALCFGLWGTPVLAAVPPSVASWDDLVAAVAAAATTPGDYTITITAPLTVTASATLDGQGSTVTLARGAGVTGDLLTLPAGQSLALQNITIGGGGAAVPNVAGPLIHSAGDLQIGSGAVLRNNLAADGTAVSPTGGYGGGVYVAIGGGFAMTGGAISGNGAAQDGGGLYLNGGTVYCFVALFFVRKTVYGQTFLIAGAAMVYTLLCVVSFLVFIQSVTSSIQVQNLLSSLSKEVLHIVDKFVSSRRDTTRTDSFSVACYQHVYHVTATANGFFEENDVDSIHSLLAGHDCAIILYPRMGDFVSANQRVASLYYNDPPLDDDVAGRLSDGLILSEKRYVDNDYRFAIQKIVEVALKAMSASINDPNTAIYCIRYLGIVTGRLARVDGSYAIVSPQGAGAKVVDQDFCLKRTCGTFTSSSSTILRRISR